MNVYGYFYNRIINNLKIDCRNVLILSNSKLNEIDTLQADALVVMMNPGESAPKEEKDIRLVETASDLLNGFSNVFEAIADKTQEVIIELMNKMNYQSVIIINISDIRNKDSNKFKKDIDSINFKNTGSEHSIFDVNRKNELDYILDRCKNKPIIVATGVAHKLRFLVDQAMSNLPHEKIVGYKSGDRYYHPSRMKNKWIFEVMNQLQPNRGKDI